MKTLLTLLILSIASFAQTAPTPGAFPETTVTFNLSPVTLPGVKSTIAGAETDILIAPSNSFQLGETTVTGSSMLFAGGRVQYIVKPVSTFIQNHSPNLNGYQFQFGLTGSAGVVKPVDIAGTSHWGERAGVFLNYAINGQWGMGVDAEWGNFPGIVHNTWTLGFGPDFHF
jgi:hypothetical protein